MNGKKRIRLYDDMSLGPTTKYIDNLFQNGNSDNANMSYNPETLHKYTADESLKRYALIRMLPGHLSESHLNGDLHIHDLEYLPFRPMNCLQHDLGFFIRNGLKVDGTGRHTSVSNSARSPEVLVNHSGQVLGASQINMSGGQSIPLFNVYLAPFVKGLEYDRIKQSIQMWVFNQNMSYVSRGGQAVFSSVNLEFDIPKFMEDKTAYGPGGEPVGVYGDYHDECQTLLEAFIDVMMEGDGVGKPHMFPNSVFRLTDSSFKYDELMHKVHELSSKFSIPYFAKSLNGEEFFDVMGCRTRLNANWTEDPEQDCLRTGNLGYISLNLPRYALGNFWEDLEEALKAATEILLIRRVHAEKVLKLGLTPFLSQPDEEGGTYYRLDNATLSFGVVGLSDALSVLTGGDITSTEAGRLGMAIMEYINSYAKKLQEQTGYRWTVLQTPAESAAGRFAIKDKRLYPTRAPVHGERGGYYYVNSTHVPVDKNCTIIDRIKVEEDYHPLTMGGHIFHGFFGESSLDVDAAMNFTKKIYEHSKLGFWTYTSAYSICIAEGKLINGIQPKCACGSDTEMYDRITGYLQKVSGWNPSKKAEFKDRRRY